MSLLLSEEEFSLWSGVLERRFIAAAQSEDSYAKAARAAHKQAVKWITNPSKDKGSFMWVCDALGLESDAVRRALKAKHTNPVEQLRSLL